MAIDPNTPSIDTIISTMDDQRQDLVALYEAILRIRADELEEAIRTQVVVQNRSFPGIAGPIYDFSGERTINIQTGKSGGTTGGMPQSTGDTSGNY